MTSTSNISRFRSGEIPKPEDGLAEWASKIKAMQQQVDADEEAEQKKLEQEIAASRLARQRRSRGTGYGSRHNSTDSAKNQEYIASLKDSTLSDVDDMKSMSERQQSQVATLRKLMGSGTPPIRDEPIPSPSSSKQSFPSSAPKAEPISLAAFMGGRATGPRLNKHAPQQDAYDPTQFEQRSKIDAPHPVFGSGGVAMPGMVHGGKSSQRTVTPSDTRTRRPSTPSAASHVNERERSVSPQKTGSRDRTISTPSRPANSVQHQVERAQERERSVSPQKSAMRVRTVSTPSQPPASVKFKVEPAHERERPVSPQKTGSRDRTISTSSRSNNVKLQVEKMQERERSVSPQKTGSRDRTMSTPSGPSHVARTRASLSSISSSSAPMPEKSLKTPSQMPSSPPPRPYSTGRLSTPSSPSTRASSFTTPSLARPIQPAPRPSLGPQIPASSSPSPAFLKAPPPKDPTPSISRLQGRGFVQNMVKASQHLEGSNSPPPLEAHRTGNGRKASVLDRWQPDTIRETSPSPSPQAPPMRKARTVGPTETTSRGFESRELRPMPSLPSLRTPAASPPTRVDPPRKGTPGLGTPGVGSATTMMIFQPTSTEDSITAVDELGVHRTGSKEAPVLSGKPLVHPTKDRAKKPRKAKSSEPRVLVEEPSSLTKVAPSANSAGTSALRSIETSGLVVPGSSPETKGRPVSPTAHSRAGYLSKDSRVADRWTSDTIIGVKAASHTPSAPEPVKKMVGRKALPGLAPTELSFDAKPNSPSLRSPNENVMSFKPALTTVSVPSPSSPNSPGLSRHSRIPVSGNRATVMDVAQAFNESTSVTGSEISVPPAEITEQFSPIGHPRLSPQPVSPAEKRRSSYERYSAIAMPPLKEEATPTSSPAGTLSRGIVEVIGSVDARPSKEDTSRLNDIVQLDYTDEPLPHVDIGRLVSKSSTIRQDRSISTISVDVLILSGSSATVVTQDPLVFYDTEVLVIVHRSKSKSSGLASTTVWAWQGKASQFKEREEQKLKELASRYGSNYIIIPQYAEPAELLQVVENQIAIRQGSRTHWTAENTTMHVVRQVGDGIIIDELDLSIRNLCSGFSYCVSVLGTIYVWHGCGSLAKERQAAMRYAKTLGSNVVEVSNSEGDDDDMFWMILGEDDYAQADYWKWRSSAAHIEPRIWHVNATHRSDAVARIFSFTQQSPTISVFVVDCVWELFVLVGQSARTQRQNIRLAISVAQSLAKLVADDRPYQPTVHVLILPSQIPLDLRLHFRDLDEARFNENNVPDHMNLLSVDEALQHLRTKSWQKVALSNTTMLPLGIDSSLLS